MKNISDVDDNCQIECDFHSEKLKKERSAGRDATDKKRFRITNQIELGEL